MNDEERMYIVSKGKFGHGTVHLLEMATFYKIPAEVKILPPSELSIFRSVIYPPQLVHDYDATFVWLRYLQKVAEMFPLEEVMEFCLE